MEKNCSVLVNSCDKYEDAWFPFFELVAKYWSDCNYSFYLNTEEKTFQYEKINVEVLNCNDPSAKALWGKRIKDCLIRIPTKYVVIMLEDFFLQNTVNQEELNNCIRMMEDNPSIVAVYFKQIEGYTHAYLPNHNYYLMDKSNMYPNNRYMLNLQASLWKREELINLIKNDDSPWSFEEEGAVRVRPGSIFLCSRNGTHTDMKGCVFPYLTDRKTGYGIWAGKWLWNNNLLLKKNGILVPSISMDHFTRFDMVKYLFKRLNEKIIGKK